MAQRSTPCKQQIKAIAARLSLAALALAMGLGAAGAIFHPGLLDVMRPAAKASVFACKPAAGDAAQGPRDMAVEPQSLMRQSSSNDAAAERIEILINTTIHRTVNESLLLPYCNFPH